MFSDFVSVLVLISFLLYIVNFIQVMFMAF